MSLWHKRAGVSNIRILHLNIEPGADHSGLLARENILLERDLHKVNVCFTALLLYICSLFRPSYHLQSYVSYSHMYVVSSIKIVGVGLTPHQQQQQGLSVSLLIAVKDE